jgi:OPA family glycerol-3-phosphate transporter-like MFS transporter 1/2
VARACWSNVQSNFNGQQGVTPTQFGLINMSFLFAYSIGMYVSGWLGDKINLKYMVFTGMVCAATIIGLIGLLGYTGASPYGAIVFLFIINGAFQSTGLPGNLAILGNWLPTKRRGLYMGLWTANEHLGNILGQEVGAVTVAGLGSWYYALFFVFGWILSVSLLYVCFVEPYPGRLKFKIDPTSVEEGALPKERAQLLNTEAAPVLQKSLETEQQRTEQGVEFMRMSPTPNKESPEEMDQMATEQKQDGKPIDILENQTENTTVISAVDEDENKPKLPFLRILCLPGVIVCAVVFLCCKSCVYIQLFQVKTYFARNFGVTPQFATTLNQLGDVGEMVGGIVLGILGDTVMRQKRAVLIPPCLMVACILYGIMPIFRNDPASAAVCFTLGGMFLGGPYNILSTAIATDIGHRYKDNKKIVSTVIGIVDATGAFSSALWQYFITFFLEGPTFLYICAGFCFVAGALFTPTAWKELQAFRKEIKMEREAKRMIMAKI